MVVAALMVMMGESVVEVGMTAMSQEARKEINSLEVWLSGYHIKDYTAMVLLLEPTPFLFTFCIFLYNQRGLILGFQMYVTEKEIYNHN